MNSGRPPFVTNHPIVSKTEQNVPLAAAQNTAARVCNQVRQGGYFLIHEAMSTVCAVLIAVTSGKAVPDSPSFFYVR
jgi:hypothetical protein